MEAQMFLILQRKAELGHFLQIPEVSYSAKNATDRSVVKTDLRITAISKQMERKVVRYSCGSSSHALCTPGTYFTVPVTVIRRIESVNAHFYSCNSNDDPMMTKAKVSALKRERLREAVAFA